MVQFYIIIFCVNLIVQFAEFFVNFNLQLSENRSRMVNNSNSFLIDDKAKQTGYNAQNGTENCAVFNP